MELLAGVNSARDVVLNTGSETIQADTGTSVFSGVLSGAGGLRKTGGGVVSLGGVNTYLGGTTLDAGTLSIGNDNALGDASGALTFNGGILELLSTYGTATSPRAITLNSSGTIQTDTGVAATFSGIISGSGSLTKAGPGTLELTGSNLYSGGTTINAGLLQIGNNSGLGTGGNITFGGGTLELLTAFGTGSLPHNVIIGNASTATIQTDTGVDVTITGVVSGAGSFIKAGPGTLALTGMNTYGSGSSGTSINAGILQIGHESSLGSSQANVTLNGGTLELLSTYGTATSTRNVILNSSGTIIADSGVAATFSGSVSGSSALVKEGPGILALTHTNTYSGGTTIDGGTLQINADASLGSSGTLVTFNSGVLELLASMNSSRNVLLNSGGGTIQSDAGVTGQFSGAFTGTGTLTKSGNGTLNLTGTNTYSGGTLLNGGTLQISSDTNLGNTSGGLSISNASTLELLAGVNSARDVVLNTGSETIQADTGTSVFSGVLSGAGGLRKTGGGVVSLGGVNTYLGGTTLDAGTLSIGNDNALGEASGALTFNGGILELLSAYGTATSPRVITLNSSGTIQTDTGVAATYSGVVSGSGSLIKSGVGTLQLTGNNLYSGGTNINAGLLQIGDNSALGNGGTITFGGGTLELLTAFGTASLTHSILINNASTAVVQTDSGVNATITGTVTGNGSFTKAGPGTLIFASNAIYSGVTAITDGTLGISGNGTISLSEAVNIGATGVFDITAYTGNAVTIGNLIGATGSSIHLGSNTLITKATVSTIYSGSIDGSGGSLIKQGTSKLTLAGANTYTGLTRIDAGTLALSGNLTSSLPGGVALAPAGAIFDLTGFTGTTLTIGSLSGGGPTSFLNLGTTSLDVNTAVSSIFAGVITGSGSLVKDGVGTLTLQGASTYSGGTTIHAGTLSVSTNPNLGSNAGTLTITGGSLLATGSFSTLRTLTIPTGDTGTVAVTAGNELDWQGNITGTGTLAKTNTGLLRIVSNTTFAGNALVNGGTLGVDGSFLVPITVNEAGTLIGTGTVGSVTNNGRVSPGNNSVGTLSIAGDYTQNAPGNLQIDISDTGSSDLNAITGDAFLNGTLTVNPLPGSFFAGSHVYTVIDTAGSSGVVGAFSNLVVLDPTLQIGIIYDPAINPTRVLLGITSNQFFSQETVTEYNPRKVELYLESQTYFNNGFAIPAQQDLINVIANFLSPLNQEELTKALDQLHPALFGAYEVVNSNIRAFISSTMARHPTELCCHRIELSLPCENSTLWLEPFGFLINQKHTGGQRGFHASTGGLMLGGDYVFENNTALGLSIGGSDTYLKWNNNIGNTRIYSGFLGLYADWLWDRWYIESALLGGWDYYDVHRHIHFSGLDRTAKNKHHGYDLDAHLGFSVDFYRSQVVLQPFACADLSYLHQEGYQEHGAESLDLSVHIKNECMLRLEEGLYVTRAYKTDRGCWSPGAWISFVSDIPVFRKNYVASLIGEQGTFTARSFYRSSNRASVGLDISTKIDNFSLSFRYGGEFGPDFIGNKGDFRLEWEF